MHFDLDLWPFDLKIYRVHPWLMGSLHVKFHDDRCKGKAVMRQETIFSNLCIVTLTFDLLTSKSIGHILDSWGVCMLKFHDDRCKGKAVMCRKHIFSNLCILTLTFDLLTSKSIGHILDSWGVCMWSFMMIGVKGKQLCARNYFQ